jgi:hypothetical protein
MRLQPDQLRDSSTSMSHVSELIKLGDSFKDLVRFHQPSHIILLSFDGEHLLVHGIPVTRTGGSRFKSRALE